MNMNFFNFKGVSQNKMNEFNNINNFNQKQNIMKKSILLLAVAASFAACTQNEEINDAISQQEIKFDQVLNKTTKAEIVDKAALASEGGFVVFGKKTPNASGDAFWVFGKDSETNGTQVSSSDAGTSWSYTGTQYWDKVATYKFYAAAPYNNNITFNKETELFTFSDVTWGTAANVANDYLIDRNGATVNAAEEGATKKAVGFEFHHVMAKVDFKVMTTINDVKINKLVMQGWNANEATFAQVASATNLGADTWTAIDCSEWTMESETIEGNVTVSSESTPIEKGVAAVSYGETYIMIPQDIAALKFIVDYEIAGEPFINQPVTLESVWGTDSHITYTLNIGGGSDPINFTVNSICGFCVNPGTEDPEVDVKP
jgi:hypothetical protein